MTNEQLAEAVARIFEVDAKRTQGEWLLEIGEDGELTLWLGSAITERESGVYDTAGEIKLYDFPEPDAECNSNAVFIEASPLMAQVIRQLWAEREAMEKESTEQCRIIGAGGERELALMTKIEEQRREIEKMVAEREGQRAVMAQAKVALIGWESRNGGMHTRSDDGRKALAALESMGV